eukprot:6173326-Pleurochrysis_carterae.AAC.1
MCRCKSLRSAVSCALLSASAHCLRLSRLEDAAGDHRGSQGPLAACHTDATGSSGQAASATARRGEATEYLGVLEAHARSGRKSSTRLES